MAYDVVQGLVLALVLGASCVYLLNRVAPAIMAALRLRASSWLSGPQRPAWMRRIGSRLAPKPVDSAGSSACDQCGGCAKAPASVPRAADKSGHC
jgi:hypothetical protein